MKLIHATPSQAEIKLPRASIEAIPRRIAEVERDTKIAISVALRELAARGININPQLNTPQENKLVEIEMKQAIDNVANVRGNNVVSEIANNLNEQPTDQKISGDQETKDTDQDDGILDIVSIRRLIQESLDEDKAA